MKLFAFLLAVALFAAPQQQSNQSKPQTPGKPDKNAPPPPPPPSNSNEPAPLFGGQVGAKSSKKTKESASLGFNGIDPSGKVEARVLSASATPASAAAIRNLNASRPSHVELVAFLSEGGLKAR